jgi:polar amino acid transport system substrate-binding protein
MTWFSRLCLGLAVAGSIALSAALTPASAADDLIAKIQKAGVFRVGMAPSPTDQSPNPATGEYEGYNVEMAQQIADLMKVKLKIVPATWATLVSGLVADQYDVIFANLFATPERALVVSFTQPYDFNGFQVMVLKDSPITSLDQLNDPGVTFVGMSGSVESIFPKEIYPKAKVSVLVGENVAAPTQDVLAGRATAHMIDPTTYAILKAQNPEIAAKTRLINDRDHLLKPVGLSYAVRPENTHMLNFLNVFIQDRINNGQYKALRSKWFDKLGEKK